MILFLAVMKYLVKKASMLHLKDKLPLCHIVHAKLKVTLNRCEKPQTKLPRPIVGGQFSEDGTGVRLTFKE